MDELDKCNPMVGKDDKWSFPSTKYSNGLRRPPMSMESLKPRKYFPFKQGFLSVATLRVGVEGIQKTVDGKHITSFAYRDVIILSHCFLTVFSSFAFSLLSTISRKFASSFYTYLQFYWYFLEFRAVAC